MQIYLDSANIEEIENAAKTGLLSGITTNPTLISKSFGNKQITFPEAIKKIASIMNKQYASYTLSAEVTADSPEEMVRQGIQLAKIDPHVIIKVPMTQAGLLAVQSLSKKRIRTNVTLVFSANQALLAAKAGAYIISPFLGRLEDNGGEAITLLHEIRHIYDHYHFRTMILAASIRSARHVTESALAGADIATIPYNIFTKLFNHSLTDQGIAQFNKDWEAFTHGKK